MAFTFINSLNTYYKWNIKSNGAGGYLRTGDIYLGATLTGQTSGAVGWILWTMGDWSFQIQGVQFLLVSGAFVGNEVCNISRGGSVIGTLTLDAAKISSGTNNTIIATGTLDTDTTTTLSANIGAVGISGGLLIGTLTSTITTAVGVLQTTTFTMSGTMPTIHDVLLIDSEWWHVQSVAGSTVTADRGRMGSGVAAHTIGINIYCISISLSGVTNIEIGCYYRIDNEYINLYYQSNGSNKWVGYRGQMGSTIAAHSSGAHLYQVDEAGMYQFYKASVDNGWGYHSISNNKQRVDAICIVGRPDQTSRTVMLSKEETIFSNASLPTLGNPTYTTWFQGGVGLDTDDTVACMGSNLLFYGADILALGIMSTMDGTTHLYDCNLRVVHMINGGACIRCTAAGWNAASYAQAFTVNKIDTFNNHNTYWHDLQLWHLMYNPSSSYIDFNGIKVTDCLYGFVFIYAEAEAFIRGAIVKRCDNGAFGFIDSGIKHFIDSVFDITTMQGFWADDTFSEEYTINIKTQTKEGVIVDAVLVKAWDNTNTKIVDTATDSAGNIPPQTVIIRTFYNGGGTYVSYNPIEFDINILGMSEEIFKETVIEAKKYIFSLKNKDPETVGTGQ